MCRVLSGFVGSCAGLHTLLSLRFAASGLVDPKRVCQRTTAQDLLLSDGPLLPAEALREPVPGHQFPPTQGVRFCSVIGSFFVLAGCPVLSGARVLAARGESRSRDRHNRSVVLH